MTRLKKCFEIDNSGSTYDNSFYYSNVCLILEQKFTEEDKIIIWDYNSKYISLKEYMWDGGTYPQCLFDAIFSKHKEAHYREFILVSDGYVSNRDVERLDRRISENMDRFSCDYTEVYY